MPSAKAADLGGDCCADLEERVAELEATTARKATARCLCHLLIASAGHSILIYPSISSTFLALMTQDAYIPADFVYSWSGSHPSAGTSDRKAVCVARI